MGLLSNNSIHAWISENGIVTESGHPIDFRNHLFLYDIYRDQSPLICCRKAAQIGFTTLAILKSFFTIYKEGIDAIYTLPTESDVRDFVKGKVNRIVERNPVLQTLVASADSMEQKRVGGSVIYYRGTFTERAALMITSGLNIHDEIDRSNRPVIEAYSSRQQHQEVKRQWVFSNTSVPGNGVDAYWAKSDKKHWFFRCHSCNHVQTPIWPESIDQKRMVFRCLKCSADVTGDRRVGEWVAETEGEWSGYQISLLMAPWVSAQDIVEYYRSKPPDFFSNFVIGEPYVGEGCVMPPDFVRRSLTTRVNSQENVVIGCDSGIKKHFVCGNVEGLFYNGITEDWADIGKLLTRWPRAIAIIDAMPDITGPRQLREEFPGRVFLVHFVRDRKTMTLIRWGEGTESGNVVADRNRLIQMVVDEFTDRRIPLQGTESDWKQFEKQWLNMFRITEPDAMGQLTLKWESNGDDHFALATAYWRIGMDRYGIPQGRVNVPSEIPIAPVAPYIDDVENKIIGQSKPKFDYGERIDLQDL